MLGFVLVLVLLAAACASSDGPEAAPGARTAGDPLFPDLGNGGYDVQHYTLDLDVQPAVNVLGAVVTIDAVATQALSKLSLDYLESAPPILRVEVDSEPVDFSQDEIKLTVTPNEPIPDETPFTVKVTASGVISYSVPPNPHLVEDFPFPGGWKYSDSGIYVTQSPGSAAAWFPNNETSGDPATYTLRVAVPTPFVVATNGHLAEEIADASTTTYVWEMSTPIPSEALTLAIGEFDVEVVAGPNGLEIRNHLLPGTAATETATLVETIDFFGDLLGPYPYDSFGFTVIGALEAPSFTVPTRVLVTNLGRLILTGAPEIARPGSAIPVVMQWFPGPLTTQDWWLRSLPTYMDKWVWQARDLHSEERAAFLSAQAESAHSRLGATSDPVGVIDDVSDLYGNPRLVTRSELTLHALRVRIGDERFFETIRVYADRFRGTGASTADFIAVAEEVSGQDLGEFFDGWLFQEAVPAIPELGLVTG